jgi:hypothetical protein
MGRSAAAHIPEARNLDYQPSNRVTERKGRCSVRIERAI